jgi:hypothetical protein
MSETFRDAILTETGQRLGLIPAYDCDDTACLCHDLDAAYQQICSCDAEPNEDMTACSECGVRYRRLG